MLEAMDGDAAAVTAMLREQASAAAAADREPEPEPELLDEALAPDAAFAMSQASNVDPVNSSRSTCQRPRPER